MGRRKFLTLTRCVSSPHFRPSSSPLTSSAPVMKDDVVMPYEAIPSPPRAWIPGVGHGILLVKKPAGMEQIWKNVQDLRLKYVPPGVDLLRLKIPFLNKKGDGRLVYTFNMDDVLEVYRNEGKYPRRIELSSVDMLRKRLPQVFGKNLGLLLSEGEQWHELRSKLNKDFMRPSAALYYVDKLQVVGEDFVNYIKRNRNQDTKGTKSL